MNVKDIKQNANLSGSWDQMHWYFLEGDLYIEGDGPLDVTKELEFRFSPQVYDIEEMRLLPIKYPWESVKEQILRIFVAEGCSVIKEQSFYKHTNLREIHLPRGVKEIQWRAFGSCEKLERVVLSEGLDVIADQAFVGCVSLRHLALPAGTKVIGQNAFTACVSLEELIIPEGVTEIGIQAFQGCISLRSLSLPDSLKKLGRGAFAPCPKLEQVVIPRGVAEIGTGAFYDAARVIAPKSMENQENDGFFGVKQVIYQDE